MFDELEALIGHLYVVGGRAVSTTPPGAVVELPPRKPQRGREQDTFFALVTPAGSVTGQASFYEQLAKLAADLYFRTSGGVTSGLREAIGVVNNNLIEHNVVAGQRYEANMICAVLRGHEVYIARAGSCVCLLRQGELFVTLPDDLRDEYAVNGLPLGYSPVADIKLSHYEVAPGQVMVLSDSGLTQADRAELARALGSGDIQAILDPLRSLSGAKSQAIIIEFVTVDTPDPIAPISPTAAKIIRSSAAPSASPAAPLSATGDILPNAPAPAPSPIEESSTPVPKSQQKSQPIRKSASVSARSTGTSASVAVEPLPPVREIASETGRNATIAGRKAVGGAASVLSVITKAFNVMLDRLLPDADVEGGPKVPAMLAAGLAILVPVIIVFIVVALRLAQVDISQFEQMVQDVQTAADQANLIPISDTNRSKSAWLGVIQRVENVEATSGRTDPILQRIRTRAQGVLDGFAKVTRRTASPIRNFSDGSLLRGPIVQGLTSMYTMDVKTNAIYVDTLNENSFTVMVRGTQPIVQKGQAVGTHSVKQLIDVVWMPEGGILRGNVLAALDIGGFLVTYSPTFAPATSQTLPGSELWVKPIAIAVWHDNFYILDVGANQIWRYVPSGQAYTDAPEPYFTTDMQPNLKNAVDFGISSLGDVYVLFADGTVKRFNGGIEQSFNFNALPDGKLQSGNAMYIDSVSNLPAMYITDPVDRSIYKFTMAGLFQARYKAADDTAFRQLSGVYVDQDRIYVASGSLVYLFTMNDFSPTPTP